MTEKENPNFIERFTVRMPDGLRDTIADRAKTNGRSMNSEIVQILLDAVDDKTETIAWSSELSPKSSDDQVMMSNAQLTKMVNVAMEEAVKAMSEKFNFVPKGGKKTPHTD